MLLSTPTCSNRLRSNRAFRKFAAPLLLGTAFFSPAPASAQDTIGALSGNWTGGGQIRLEDGRTERLSCRANYSSKEGGSSLGMSIRCASQSYKIELRSSMRVASGRVSGTWEERSFNAGGSLAGRSAAGRLDVSFNGSMNGSISVSYAGANQRVSISTGGAGISQVSLNLSRG